MKRPLFNCAKQIALAEKRFDTTRHAIETGLAARGEYEATAEHDVTTEDGTVTTTVLRLNIATRSEYVTCWTVSLKLHNIRIDGIDHESRFRKLDGTKGRGWHRHHWNDSHDSAERDKREVTCLDNVSNRREFLTKALREMGITLNGSDDNGTPELQFD